ncbi:MAG: carboxypeptidase-like regulatory domain-containing protein [Alistipes ihumii]
MTHKTLIKISLLLVLMLTGPLSAAYAQKGAAMKGMVRDEFGKPLVGVAIRSANGDNHSVTQKDGSYSINVNDGSDRVVFSYLGYADQSVPYQSADVDVKMPAGRALRHQTIHMGYTDQKLKDVSRRLGRHGRRVAQKPGSQPVSGADRRRLTGLYLDEYQSEPTREKLTQ